METPVNKSSRSELLKAEVIYQIFYNWPRHHFQCLKNFILKINYRYFNLYIKPVLSIYVVNSL